MTMVDAGFMSIQYTDSLWPAREDAVTHAHTNTHTHTHKKTHTHAQVRAGTNTQSIPTHHKNSRMIESLH